MSKTILTQKDGKAGIITLNRPEAINALTVDMIEQIDSAFRGFLADDGISLVLLEGAGARGFCAGGDVRAVRQAVLDGATTDFTHFFEAEYALNLRISEAEKPVVALTDGVVMGGGIGLASHAAYRISTDRGRFAMPESAIGLHCDVGANAILAQCPRHQALAFLMGGQPVGVADAMALGLVDCVVGTEQFEAVRGAIIKVAQEGDVPAALGLVMQSHAIDPGGAEFIDFAGQIASAFEASCAAEAVANLAAMQDADPRIAEYLVVLDQRCPTSLEVIYASFAAACAAPDVASILARDLRLSVWMVQRPDFSEGVRALLVDKDRNPKWDPKTLDAVDIEAIKPHILG